MGGYALPKMHNFDRKNSYCLILINYSPEYFTLHKTNKSIANFGNCKEIGPFLGELGVKSGGNGWKIEICHAAPFWIGNIIWFSICVLKSIYFNIVLQILLKKARKSSAVWIRIIFFSFCVLKSVSVDRLVKRPKMFKWGRAPKKTTKF